MHKSFNEGINKHFWEAIQRSILPAIKAFIDAGADVNARNEAGNSPLHEAAIRGAAKAITLLLNSGADPTARNNDGYTAADVAETRQHIDIANLIDRAARLRDLGRRAADFYVEPSMPDFRE